MDKSFLDLKESKDGECVWGQVMHKGTFMRVQYKFKGTPYWIEIPVVEANDWVKEGDIIELQLLIMKEIEE